MFRFAILLGLICAFPAKAVLPPPPPSVVVLATGVNGVTVTYLEEYQVAPNVTGLRLRVCGYVDLPQAPGPNGWYKVTWVLVRRWLPQGQQDMRLIAAGKWR